MTFVLVAGSTGTASIDGISAAGATPALLAHTPGADAEIVAYGRPVLAPIVPVSPEGCPTPGLVTRAVRDLVGFDLVVVDAGIAGRTGAPTVGFGDDPGADIRAAEAVPNARRLHDRARAFAAAHPDEELVIGETIPGGTTTAMAVLRALGEDHAVSSSLPTNPMALKREVVAAALNASDLEPGALAARPIEAVRTVGDPTLAVTLGLIAGGLDRGAEVILAGGTQMIAAAALARHADATGSLTVATTPFVADDEAVEIGPAAEAFDAELVVTDPGFRRGEHVATDHYLDGVAKEGVGMGGALHLADRAGVAMAAVRKRLFARYEALLDEEHASADSSSAGDGSCGNRPSAGER